MPTAPIDSNGTELFFTDTGPVPGVDDYTTLVIFHGRGFNGNIFNKLVPLAKKHNIRLILPNRRGYAGSTPYTMDELADIKAGRGTFLERTGVEVAQFLVWLCRAYELPIASLDRKSGGLAVMGWSQGVVTTLSLLAHPDTVSKELFEALTPYLRRFIIHDVPPFALGMPIPEEGYNIDKDPELPTTSDVMSRFPTWVSSYYTHDLSSHTLRGLDFRKFGDRPSILGMSPEDLHLILDGAAALRNDFPVVDIVMQGALASQAQRALFDSEVSRTTLPDLQIVLLVGTCTTWTSTWAYFEVERRHHESLAVHGRPIRFIEIEGGNHFSHWDLPDQFFRAVLDALEILLE